MQAKDCSTKFESFQSNFILIGHFSERILNVISGSVEVMPTHKISLEVLLLYSCKTVGCCDVQIPYRVFGA